MLQDLLWVTVLDCVYQHQTTEAEKWKGEPEVDPHKRTNYLDKRTKASQWRSGSFIIWIYNYISIGKKTLINNIPYTRINSKWILNLIQEERLVIFETYFKKMIKKKTMNRDKILIKHVADKVRNHQNIIILRSQQLENKHSF